jgi:prolyl-tRNA synthetase
MKPEEHWAHAERLATDLAEAGLDVLIDDRDERRGSSSRMRTSSASPSA